MLSEQMQAQVKRYSQRLGVEGGEVVFYDEPDVSSELEGAALSVAKWERVVAELSAGKWVRDGGPQTCGFCRLYFDPLYVRCMGCPVMHKSGERYCRNTPYARWVDFMDSVYDETDAALAHAVELAKAELEFVTALAAALEA